MFLLNLQSKEPIYEQIQKQIRKFIAVGALAPGDRLPSVRQLAKDNGINPNTVAKAYSELERLGFVCNMAKKGVYVAEIGKTSDPAEEIMKALRPLKESGITKTEIRDVLDILYEGGNEDA